MLKIFDKLDKIEPVYKVTYHIVLVLCKVLLIADILITTMAVIGRYVSFIPDPSWSEEVVLTCMAYMAVLSAALAIRNKTHIRMTAFDRYLPRVVLLALDLISGLAILWLAIIMITEGWTYAVTIGKIGSYVSLPFLSRFWMYFPIPVAGVAMATFEIEDIYKTIKAFFVHEEVAP